MTFLVCTLAHQACRQKQSVLYRRGFPELVSALAHGQDGEFHERLTRRLAKVSLTSDVLTPRDSHEFPVAQFI